MIEYVIKKPNGDIWDYGVISLEEMQGCIASNQWLGYQITMRPADVEEGHGG